MPGSRPWRNVALACGVCAYQQSKSKSKEEEVEVEAPSSPSFLFFVCLKALDRPIGFFVFKKNINIFLQVQVPACLVMAHGTKKMSPPLQCIETERNMPMQQRA